MVVIRDTKRGNIALIAGMSITARDWSQDFAKLQNMDIAISSLRDTIVETIKGVQPRNITHIAGTAITGRDWSLDFAKLQNIDVLLSNVRDTLDSSIKSVQPRNITHIAGTALTARDWSLDFAKLQNLDRLQNIDIAISALRDAIISRFNEQIIAAYTTTPIAAGATWTSTSINVQGFGRITGSCYSDQPGTLYIEQSPDGVNWDVQSTFSYSTGSLLGFSVEVVCPYARIRYVNGATSQSVFRLYVFLRRI